MAWISRKVDEYWSTVNFGWYFLLWIERDLRKTLLGLGKLFLGLGKLLLGAGKILLGSAKMLLGAEKILLGLRKMSPCSR